jgi:hypothetical protein
MPRGRTSKQTARAATQGPDEGNLSVEAPATRGGKCGHGRARGGGRGNAPVAQASSRPTLRTAEERRPSALVRQSTYLLLTYYLGCLSGCRRRQGRRRG